MSEHSPLPVAGYTAQSTDRVALVNQNKQAEERILRMLDALAGVADPRWTALARTHIETGFMAMNRAIFQPTRITLDGE